MSVSIMTILNNRISLLSETVKGLEETIKNYPEGIVHVKYSRGKPYYYIVENGVRDKYLSKKDSNTISSFLQKAYSKEMLYSAKRELSVLKDAVKLYPKTPAEDIYDNLPDARKKYVQPIVLGDKDFVEKWMNAPYERKGFGKNSPVYITLKGDRVRSKSEMIIADRLWANGIPYKYECPIIVDGEIIHPDFTILRLSDMKILYHEHCGMVDDPEYAEKMTARINSYNKEGVYLGDRLFMSMETSKTPLDVRVIDNLIQTKFR